MSRAGVVLALALSLAWVYAGVRDHEFLRYDDDLYVTENPNLRAALDLGALRRTFTTPYDTNWIPLTTLSWQLDHAWHGLDAGAYLVENVVLHALSAALLFLALVAMTGAQAPSAFAAGVFALHPLHVETVAWVVERKGVLSGLCFHAALLVYAHAARAAAPRQRGTAIAFGAGLLAKQWIVPLPALLVALDFWPLRRLPVTPTLRQIAGSVREKWLLFALALAGSLAAVLAQRAGGSMDHGDVLPPGVRLANAALAIAAYLRDAVWPAQLAAFYPHPERAVSRLAAAGAALALAGVTFACWRVRARQPWWGVGWLWFLVLLLPTLGILQVGAQARADRYTYLPLTGIAIAVGWSAWHFAGANAARRRAVAALGLALLAACGVAARRQVAVWRDTETLFRHAAAVTQGNFLAEHAIGAELLRRGEAAEAKRHFAEAVRLRERWPEAHFGLADALAAEGRFEEAIRRYERGLRDAPRNPRGQLRLTRALLATGRLEEALGRARHALATAQQGDRAGASALLGVVLLASDQPQQAQAACEHAIALRPDLAEAHGTLGMALLVQGRAPAAYASLRRALELGGPAAGLHLALGDTATVLGHTAVARAHYADAQRLATASGDLELAREAASHLAER